MKVLSREQLLLLHSQLINRYGGTHGVRDEGLLDSALNAPFQGFGDYEFYPTVTDKAVRLGYGSHLNAKNLFHASFVPTRQTAGRACPPLSMS